MRNDDASTLNDPVFFGLLAGGLAGYGAYRADLANVPVIAPLLDWSTGHVYLLFAALPRGAWFTVSGGLAGGLVFVIVTLLFARLDGLSSGGGKMETRLKRRARRQKRDHWAGFNS